MSALMTTMLRRSAFARLVVAWIVGVVGFALWTQPVAAQAVREERPTGYWVANGGITAGGFGVGALVTLIEAQPTAFLWWPWDAEVAGVNYPYAGRIADVTLLTTMALPLPMLIEGVDERSAAATMIYAQTHSVNFLLTAVAKFTVRRPRPYTYDSSSPAADHDCGRDSDRCLSFFSGHASTSFAAALSSVMLVSESARIPPGVRLGAWGVQLGLAGATAHLRVRAGKHFPSDVIVGSLVGSTIGVVVPLLHRDVWSGGEFYEHSRPGVAELSVGAMGLVTGVALPWLVEMKRPDESSAVRSSFAVRPTTLSGAGTGLELFGTW